MKTLSNKNKNAVIDFFNHADTGVHVRTVKLTNELRDQGARELRTTKFDHLAESWDELGNVTILTADRRVLNLTEKEYRARAI